MSPVLEDAATHIRGALAVVVAAALALVLPTAFTAPADATGIALAVLTVALVALFGLGLRLVAVASRSVAATLPTGEDLAPVLPGRVTDPVHHPLRPRAPGMA